MNKLYLYDLYTWLFGRPIFRRWNFLLFYLGLRGLGILNYKNNYLNGEKDWLLHYLSQYKTPVILDVGANIGDYSALIFQIKSNAIIHAFEPHPKNHHKLINRFTASHFYASCAGMGKEQSSLKLFDYADNEKDGSSHASLYRDVIESLHKHSAISYDVPIITLDSYCQEHDINRIDLLKIDTEGNELNVLLGALNYLKSKKINAIHFEFNEMNIISRANFKDFWNLLDEYALYRILPGGKLLPLLSYNPLACEIYAYQNIVAILKKTDHAVYR